jgi:hypothetical protein
MIAARFRQLLERELTVPEQMRCEELALNWFTGPVLSWLEAQGRKRLQHTFEVLHAALARGVVRGASRGTRRHDFARAEALAIYMRLDNFHPGMSDSEAQAMTRLIDRHTPVEVARGVQAAQARRVQHVRYVLAVVEGAVQRARPRTRALMRPFEQTVVRARPSDWRRRLSVEDCLRMREAERVAEEDLHGRA